MLMNQIAPQNEITVQNLLTAYESESNAHIRYAAYAESADSEGLHGTASLMRAAARSAQINADNHARVIRQLGGEPEAQIQPAESRTTLENLVTAMGDRSYVIDSMYPRLLAENQRRDNSAGRTLTWALEAEKTHARLLNEEIRRIETNEDDTPLLKPAEYYVRPVCGLVSKSREPERCWACDRFCATSETVQ